MPLGESGAEVETRCKHAISTLRRDADKSDTYTNVIVTHGYTSRLIAKIIMNQSVSKHAKEQNPGNCWVRYISGHAGEPKNDYGWIYTGNYSHLSKLIENSVNGGRNL
jgi:broad specificity phosphatase PhoE